MNKFDLRISGLNLRPFLEPAISDGNLVETFSRDSGIRPEGRSFNDDFPFLLPE